MGSNGVNDEFKLYGIFGFPLNHTLSPVMQEAAFKAAGLKAFYLPFEVRPAEFRRLLKGRRRLLLDGFNVTVPYKEEAAKRLDGVSPEARAIGAVNTVVKRGNRWLGFNTDVSGFALALEEEGKFRVRGKHVLVLGAGGSARAVVYALAKRGAKQIVIANRTTTRAKKIARDYRRFFLKTKFVGTGLKLTSTLESPGPVDLVVNATSIGLKPRDKVLMDPRPFPHRTLFVDLIYNPAETRFLKLARLSRHRTLNGLGMLVRQGAEAFRLWTGRKAPVKIMRRALTR